MRKTSRATLARVNEQQPYQMYKRLFFQVLKKWMEWNRWPGSSGIFKRSNRFSDYSWRSTFWCSAINVLL